MVLSQAIYEREGPATQFSTIEELELAVGQGKITGLGPEDGGSDYPANHWHPETGFARAREADQVGLVLELTRPSCPLDQQACKEGPLHL